MRVLLAEDDRTTRTMLRAVLEMWKYKVLEAADGNQAWERLRQADPPRLVILDWMMPGPDGVTLCTRLREMSPSPYVILLTSRSDKGDVVQGLAAGADDYIIKPFDPDELRARLDVGKRMLELREDLERRVKELEDALDHIKTLQGILPICMHCHRIRNDRESWDRIETYIQNHSDATFSHGICPECLHEHYPDIADQ